MIGQLNGMQGRLPTIALVGAGVVLAASISVAVAMGIGAWNNPRHQPVGTSLVTTRLEENGLRVTDVVATAFGVTITMEAGLDSPLPDGSVATFDLADLSIEVDGASIDSSTWAKAVDYGVSPDRRAALFAVQGGPLPASAKSIRVSVPRLYVVPPDGDGVPQDGVRSAVAILDASRVPGARALAVTSPVFDTGFGWRYVIDSVESDPTSVRLTYHVDGDTTGLQPVPVSDPTGQPAVLLATDGRQATVVLPRDPGARAITAHFGGAARPVEHPGSVAFERVDGGWSSALLQLDGVSAPVEVRPSSLGGRDYVSIVATSTLLLNAYGSPGQVPQLVDDRGTMYPLYHGSSSGIPPIESEWDFEGPIDPTATRIVLTVNGYSELEAGDWSLTIPLD